MGRASHTISHATGFYKRTHGPLWLLSTQKSLVVVLCEELGFGLERERSCEWWGEAHLEHTVAQIEQNKTNRTINKDHSIDRTDVEDALTAIFS